MLTSSGSPELLLFDFSASNSAKDPLARYICTPQRFRLLFFTVHRLSSGDGRLSGSFDVGYERTVVSGGTELDLPHGLLLLAILMCLAIGVDGAIYLWDLRKSPLRGEILPATSCYAHPPGEITCTTIQGGRDSMLVAASTEERNIAFVDFRVESGQAGTPVCSRLLDARAFCSPLISHICD